MPAARELSDDMSALLYNLDSTMSLRGGQISENETRPQRRKMQLGLTWRHGRNCDQSVRR